MATTIGIKMFYGKPENLAEARRLLQLEKVTGDDIQSLVDLAASADEQIYGVQNIPELQQGPNTIDVTSLEDYEEQSEPGLISGSALAITLNYKAHVWTKLNEQGEVVPYGQGDDSNFEQCYSISDDDIYLFRIQFPNGRWFLVLAKARTRTNAFSLGASAQFTLNLFKKSSVKTGYPDPTKTDAGTPSVHAEGTKSDLVPSEDEEV